MAHKKKVVVIGGGNGSAVCLEGLKKYAGIFDISAVISMSDSGGSSGKLRKEFNTLPPGDIMRAVLSLSKYDYKMLRQIFYKPRFKGVGKLDSHNLGNLFLTLISQYSRNFLHALEALSQSVEAKGRVYPVTLENINLVAELDNGKIIKTEAFIDNPVYNRGWKIKRVWLEPRAQAYPKAATVIKEADIIVLSPGSLYTSLVATLLPDGIKEAIAKSKAKIIYVSGNAYRLDGETGPEKLSEMIIQLEKYLPRVIDLVIYNNHKLNKKQKSFYKEKKWGVFKFDRENLKGKTIKALDLEASDSLLDPVKLAKVLKKEI
ncbi:MAG: YvcK family protein [Candidatus Magasanikbacteria bacterium]|nr:YvcK family protein [Candidatus Magasanikbacteria bacterium]